MTGERKRADGHTLYLPDHVWQRLRFHSYNGGKTISAYVTALLDCHVPEIRPARSSAGDDTAEASVG